MLTLTYSCCSVAFENCLINLVFSKKQIFSNRIKRLAAIVDLGENAHHNVVPNAAFAE
jgi:hypothetical protein